MTDRLVSVRRVSGFDVLFVLFGGFLLYLVSMNAPQVVAAARPGAGVQGVFIAEQLICVQHPGHQACDWQGEFRSDDGRVVRTDIVLYGGTQGVAQGEHTRARDVGRAGKVYRPDGTREWIMSVPAGVGALLLLVKGGVFGLGPALLGCCGAYGRQSRRCVAHRPFSGWRCRGSLKHGRK